MFRSHRELYSPSAPNTSSEESDVEQKILELNRLAANKSLKGKAKSLNSSEATTKWKRLPRDDAERRSSARERHSSNTSSDSASDDSDSGSSSSTESDRDQHKRPSQSKTNQRKI